jgi:hypothetical protein
MDLTEAIPLRALDTYPQRAPLPGLSTPSIPTAPCNQEYAEQKSGEISIQAIVLHCI